MTSGTHSHLSLRMGRDRLLLAISAASIVPSVALVRSVARRDTREQDHRLREAVVAKQGPVNRALAQVVGPLGKEWFHAPVALVIALALRTRRRPTSDAPAVGGYLLGIAVGAACCALYEAGGSLQPRDAGAPTAICSCSTPDRFGAAT